MKNKTNKLHDNCESIVRLPKGGHGVLVGNMILTAAHCVTFSTEGEMVLGDFFIEEIETHQGRVKATPLVVEPVRDIAVLGCLDDQVFFDEMEAYQRFCETTRPMPLAKGLITPGQPLPVRILNFDRTWCDGTAGLFDESSPSLWIKSDHEIKGGASGGPIVNQRGELVGIVSHFTVPNGAQTYGSCPRPLMALPTWICRKLTQPIPTADEVDRVSTPQCQPDEALAGHAVLLNTSGKKGSKRAKNVAPTMD